jgi:hypothetical protein
MSLFQFYSYFDGSLHVSAPQAHPQKNSHNGSHNHWFSGCTVQVACFACCGPSHNMQSTRPEWYSHWTNGCVKSCVNSSEDGPVGPKHVEIRRNKNKIEIVTSVGLIFHMFLILLFLDSSIGSTTSKPTENCCRNMMVFWHYAVQSSNLALLVP